MLAGRLRVPEVRGPARFEEVFAAAVNPWMLDRGAARSEAAGVGPEVTLFVGPEGGWAPEEVAVAGQRTLSLGPRNLRADTAALVALAKAI